MNHPKEHGRLELPLSEIVIGERLRKDNGDIDVLSLSILAHSLLNPIIVHETEKGRYELVDGYRRILAFKSMGKTTIPARLFDTLDEETKFQLELELCLRRKSLTFVEEARACKRILLEKRRASTIGGIGRFTGMVKNKEIAMELGMSEPCFSTNLKIADALDQHPELEQAKSKAEVLSRISRGEYAISDGVVLKTFQENYLVDTPINLLKSISNKIADLIILHPDGYDSEQVILAETKLKMGGSIILFCEMDTFQKYRELLEGKNLYVSSTPYIWHVKNEDIYIPFLWAGKSREMPLRLMPIHITQARSKMALSIKAKPYNLVSMLVKSNTEAGGFVVVPQCDDLDTVRFCIDSQRNVRAATTDKILRDRLLMTIKN